MTSIFEDKRPLSQVLTDNKDLACEDTVRSVIVIGNTILIKYILNGKDTDILSFKSLKETLKFLIDNPQINELIKRYDK